MSYAIALALKALLMWGRYNERKVLKAILGCLIFSIIASKAEASVVTCSVTTPSLNFGSYNPLSGAVLDTTGTINVTCSAVLTLPLPISYTIKLTAGNSGAFSLRQLNFTTNHLGYNLYTNLSHTTIWGDGTGGSSTVADNYTLTLLTPNVTRPYTVYGRIGGGQNVSAGAYTDIVNVTVTY